MKKIITVTREFGSGGRELAKRLSEKLGYKYYDKQILSNYIQKYGYDKDYIKSIDKIGNDDFPYVIARSFSLYSAPQKQATNILVLEQKIIKELASKNNCVFVGMGSDLILRDYNSFNIFVYANMDHKLARCKEKASETNENLSDKNLVKQIKNADKSRRKHYLLLGSDSWGQKENYNLCINTTGFEIKNIIDKVENFAKEYFKERE